jgi:hypothetical protein
MTRERGRLVCTVIRTGKLVPRAIFLLSHFWFYYHHHRAEDNIATGLMPPGGNITYFITLARTLALDGDHKLVQFAGFIQRAQSNVAQSNFARFPSLVPGCHNNNKLQQLLT